MSSKSELASNAAVPVSLIGLLPKHRTVYNATTSPAGVYSFSQLPAGTYYLKSTAPLFDPFIQTGTNGFASPIVTTLSGAPVGSLNGKVDTLLWNNVYTAALTNDVTYWQIAMPLILMGMGLPLFFVPLTALSLGSVEERETASAAGLQNFLRTLSGAVATSLVTTAWEDKATYMHAELSGLADRNADLAQSMAAAGTSSEAAAALLNKLVQSQSVMIATNHMFLYAGVIVAITATGVWLMPRQRGQAQAAMGH